MQLSDFYSAAYQRDPYPLYEQLRAAGPFVRVAPDVLATGRHDVVNAVLGNRSLGRDFLISLRGRYGDGIKDHPVFAALSRQLLMMNPPEHTKLRKLILAAFNAKQVDALREIVQQTTDRLIDAFRPGEEVDIIRDFAHPLPLEIIFRIMGLPIADSSELQKHIDSFSLLTQISELDEAQLEAASGAYRALQQYFLSILEDRRARPGNDLISLLLSVEDHGLMLAQSDIVINVIFFFIAGHETTVNMIGNMLISLYRHSEQLALLKRRPELLSRAVAECIRYDSSVPRVQRQVLEDTEVMGVPLTAGTSVIAFIASANRDPSYIDRADEFLIERNGQDSQLLAFGPGPHFCVGARVATLELEIALSTLIRRLPRLTLTNLDTLEWRHTFRGVESLKATW